MHNYHLFFFLPFCILEDRLFQLLKNFDSFPVSCEHAENTSQYRVIFIAQRVPSGPMGRNNAMSTAQRAWLGHRFQLLNIFVISIWGLSLSCKQDMPERALFFICSTILQIWSPPPKITCIVPFNCSYWVCFLFKVMWKGQFSIN